MAKSKRKRGEQSFSFDSFCDPGNPTHFSGCSFLENMKALLPFGQPEAVGGQGEDVQCHSFQLELHRHPPTCVRLFILEEDVETSTYRRCYYCRSVGWGHNIICRKRFHFILPTRDTMSEVQNIRLHINSEWLKKASAGSKSVNINCYLMHGVVHSNGFGHLLQINGFEGGSHFLSGHHVLDLWDRICTALQVRKISLMDDATKGKMELRLIHGVAYGEPWFGRWGYKFGRGSYGVTQQMYQHSLEALQALPLCLLLPHFACFGHEIPMIVTKYQSFCNRMLLTLSNLFRFMIELKARLPANSLYAMDHHGVVTAATCRWSTKRVEMAAQVIVQKLKKSEFRWVSRQEIRDAARAYIGDTGLLDYVLKTLGNHVVGNHIVRRVVNPVNKVLEYCLEDVSNLFPGPDNFNPGNHSMTRIRFQLTRVQLMRDMFYLYKHILKEPIPTAVTGMLGAIPVVVRMVLDTKHLVKDYQQGLPCAPKEDSCCHGTMKLRCSIWMRAKQTTELPPYETVMVPTCATIAELKREVETHFRAVYWGLKSFVAESIVHVKSKDSDLVYEDMESGSSIIVEGRIEENNGEEIYEEDDTSVDCLCGVKDEDGERMVCCDVCEVWEHTRCVGIADEEEVPPVFLCGRCEKDITAFPATQ